MSRLPDTRLFHIIITIILASVCFLLYQGTINFELVYDDHELLINEPMASGQEPWSHAFSKPVDRLYRPLRTISYSLTREYGNVPRDHHAINILFFALTVISVYWFLVTLSGRRIFPAIAALLYAMHPVHAEVVPWITGGRANLLAGPFFFSCLALYVLARKRRTASDRFSFLALSCLSFVAALFSKESALVIPIIIAALELLRPWETKANDTMKKQLVTLAIIIPFVLIGAGFFMLRTEVLKGAAQVADYHGGSFYATAVSMLPVFSDYIRISFVPVNLCAMYTVGISDTLLSPAPLVSLIIIFAALVSGIVFFRRAPLFSFAVFFFFICLIPASNIIPIAAMKANRFLSEACLSACMIYATLIAAMLKSRTDPSVSKVAAAVCALLIVNLFLASTVQFRNIWKNNLALWTATVKCAPNSEAAYNNLGIECYKANNIPNAISAFEKARDLNPGFVNIRKNLADMYAAQGRYLEALEEFKAVFFYNPSPDVIFKISLLYERLGDKDHAVLWLKKAVDRQDMDQETRILLLKRIDMLDGKKEARK